MADQEAGAIAAAGSVEDIRALSTAISLSRAATHPVNVALIGLGNRMGDLLPQQSVHSFRLTPGTAHAIHGTDCS